MTDAAVLGELMQFGAAGLIAVMWLAERRSAVVRDRQLSEAHATLTAGRHHVDALVRVVQDNTLALGRVESSQRELSQAVRDLARWRTASDTPIDQSP